MNKFFTYLRQQFKTEMCVPLLMVTLFILTSPVWTHAAGNVQVIGVPNGGVTPDAEIDSQGIIHLVYVSGEKNVGEDVYYVKSVDNGKHFSPPIRVNSEAGTAHPGGAYRGPDIAVGKANQVHVVWYVNAYQRKLPKDQWGVFYAHLNASETAFVAARNLNRLPSDNYSLAADGNGKVAVLWTAGKAYMNLSNDGGKTFSSTVTVEKADPCECCATRAYFSTSGNLYFAYRDKAENMRDMYLMTLTDGHEAFSKEKLSATPWKIEGCPMTGTYLTGRFTTQSGKGENLVAGWETKGKIYFAHLSPDGGLRPPGEIKVAEFGKYPVVLTASDGTTLVAWKNGLKLEWRMYDGNGKPKGSLESASVDNSHRPAGVVTMAGDFLLFP
ncbi:hypothetical protein IH992_32655 [Candidatus Poribacteria bacterium]|nr:hypothetical protein [Candidatus Poribacteria bacterium]